MRARFRFGFALAVAGILFGIEAFTGSVTARAADVTIKLALTTSGDSILNQMADVIGKDLATRVPGRIDWQVFPGSELGGDGTIMKGLMQGTHMMTMNGNWFQSLQPEFGVFDTPFFFDDQAQVKKVIAAVQGDLAKLILAKGIVLVGIGDLGFRETSNNVRPIVTPADFKGIKLRTTGNPFSIQIFRTLGANPTPMDSNTLYMAMREGVVDGQENPLPSIWAGKYFEVQKYISMTNHVFSPIFVGVSASYWNRWPPEIQQAVRAATQVGCDFSFTTDIRQAADAKSRMLAANPQLKFNDVDTAAFKLAVQPLVAENAKRVGADVWNKALAAVK